MLPLDIRLGLRRSSTRCGLWVALVWRKFRCPTGMIKETRITSEKKSRGLKLEQPIRLDKVGITSQRKSQGMEVVAEHVATRR